MLTWWCAGGVTFKRIEKKDAVHQSAGGLFVYAKALMRGMS
jgi:hypothetical protein